MRACSGCTECCRYELPDLHACPFLHPEGTGCGIQGHPLRPARCASFSCAWLESEALPEDLRPDRTRVVFAEPKASSPLRLISRAPVVGYYDSARLDPDEALAVGRRLYEVADVDLVGLGDFRTKRMDYVGDERPVLRAKALKIELGGVPVPEAPAA